MKFLPYFWLFIVAILTYFLYGGGDASIVALWLYIAWTVPFGLIWHFLVYDIVVQWVSSDLANFTGSILVPVLAFLFWFVFYPRARAMALRRRLR